MKMKIISLFFNIFSQNLYFYSVLKEYFIFFIRLFEECGSFLFFTRYSVANGYIGLMSSSYYWICFCTCHSVHRGVPLPSMHHWSHDQGVYFLGGSAFEWRGGRQTPPPPSPPDTVNRRTMGILLEYILVSCIFEIFIVL